MFIISYKIQLHCTTEPSPGVSDPRAYPDPELSAKVVQEILIIIISLYPRRLSPDENQLIGKLKNINKYNIILSYNKENYIQY